MYFFYQVFRKIIFLLNDIMTLIKKRLFLECGEHIHIGTHCKLSYRNMILGNNISIGDDSLFLSSIAKIIIKDHVIFGPHVYVITGNHNYKYQNLFIDQITEDMKNSEDDKDVIFEGDNWIGAGSIILKGVTIAKGSIIGAGSVVTKSTIENGIYAGNPAKFIKNRFE